MNNISYFIFRGKETKEVIFFLESQWHHNGFPDAMLSFIRAVYSVEGITQAEAETYEEFGVAPIVTPEDVGVVLLGDNFETRNRAGEFIWCDKG